MSEQVKRLRMIAGPNGSGKSTVILKLARERSASGVFRLNYYLNADDIERALVSIGLDLARFGVEISLTDLCALLRKGGRIPDDHPFYTEARLEGSLLCSAKADGYLAASIVDLLRSILMRRGDSFSFETVMSHRQKIEDFKRAREEGYKTYLYFVCTNSEELSVARVQTRISIGGHAVPVEKIRERYDRSLGLAREAASYAYRAYFFDNSEEESIFLAEFDPNGKCNLKVPQHRLPRWFRDWVWNVRLSAGDQALI